MNIEILTESSNRVFIDQNLPNLPEEIKELISDPEYSYYAMGPIEGGSVYDFSNNQLYRKENEKIQKMEYTGEFYFGDIFYLNGDRDLNLIYKATFIKGLLEEINLHTADFIDNEDRKRKMADIVSRIEGRNELFANPLFKWVYKPYALIVFSLFWLIRRTLFFVFKGLDWLLELFQKLLLPI